MDHQKLMKPNYAIKNQKSKIKNQSRSEKDLKLSNLLRIRSANQALMNPLNIDQIKTWTTYE